MKINSKFIFFLILSVVAIGVGLYGINKEYYTSTQVDMFLELNHVLSWVAAGGFWLNITELGDAILFFPLFSFLIFRNIQAWAALFGAIPLSAILSSVGKEFFSVTRPAATIDTEKFTVIGEILTGATSLPSGHTISIFATVSAILYIYLYGDKKIKYLIIWSIGLVSLAFLVAFSRVAVGAHWPFDLLLGSIFGIFGGLSGAILTLKYSVWWHWMTVPKFRYIHAIILSALSFAMIVEYSQLVIAWLSLIVAGFVTIRLLILQSKRA